MVETPRRDAAAILNAQIKARDEQIKAKDEALRKIHEAAGANDFWLDDLKAQAEGKEMLERLYWPLLENNAKIKKLAEEAL